MKFDPQKHHRRSIRLKGYDYSLAGAYFVTLVAWHREMLFGEFVNGNIVLNEFGKIVQDEWERTGKIRREVELSTYIVMPNHFHGIVVLLSDTLWVSDVGATGRSPLPHGPAPKSLGSLIAGFKSAVTKQINMVRNVQGIPVWQRNYVACPEPVEGNASSAMTAKWIASTGTSNPTRPCGRRTTKTRIMFALRVDQIPRHLIPRATFKGATRPLLVHTSPLLEEKWDLRSQALIPNIRDPFLHHRSRAGTRLATDYPLINFRNAAGMLDHLFLVV